jgi:hypothetical protein
MLWEWQMKKAILIMMLSISSFAIAGRGDEIVEEPFDLEGTYEMATVEKAIKKALVGRGWRVNETEPGIVHATLRLRQHVVKVRIEYSKTELTVFYVDSTNMKYKEKKGKRTIHRKYHGWVNNVQYDVLVHLSS